MHRFWLRFRQLHWATAVLGILTIFSFFVGRMFINPGITSLHTSMGNHPSSDLLYILFQTELLPFTGLFLIGLTFWTVEPDCGYPGKRRNTLAFLAVLLGISGCLLYYASLLNVNPYRSEQQASVTVTNPLE